MTPSTGTFVLGLVCLYLTTRCSLLDIMWLSLATVDTFRALRLVRANGRRVGMATRRKAMKEALTSWIVSAAIAQIDPIASRLFGWLPFYAPLRWIICLGFIAIRATASTAIYNSLLRPLLRKYETPIDLILLLLHTISDIIIYHAFTAPAHLVNSLVSRIKGVFAGRNVPGTRAEPIVVDDTSGDEDIQVTITQAEVSMATPHIPGRLFRSARKPAAVRPISRAEAGESSTPQTRTTGANLRPIADGLSEGEDEGNGGVTTFLPVLSAQSYANTTASRSGRKRAADALDDTDPSHSGRSVPRARRNILLNATPPTSIPSPLADAPPRAAELHPRISQIVNLPPHPINIDHADQRAGPSTRIKAAPLSSTATGTSALRKYGPAKRLYPTLPTVPIRPPSSTTLPSSSSTSSTGPTHSRRPLPKHSTQLRVPSQSHLPPSRAKRPIPSSSTLRVHPDPPSHPPAKSTSAESMSSASSGRSAGLGQVINRANGKLKAGAAQGGKGKEKVMEKDVEVEVEKEGEAVVGQKRRAGTITGSSGRESAVVKRPRREGVGPSSSRLRAGPQPETTQTETRKAPARVRAGGASKPAAEVPGVARTRVTRGRP